MKEIDVKNNTTGLKVFINGVPDLKSIPKDEANIVIAALELQIAEYYKQKRSDNNESCLPTHESKDVK